MGKPRRDNHVFERPEKRKPPSMLPPTLPILTLSDEDIIPIGTMVELRLEHYAKSIGQTPTAIITKIGEHASYSNGSTAWGYCEGYEVYLIINGEYTVVAPNEIGKVL